MPRNVTMTTHVFITDIKGVLVQYIIILDDNICDYKCFGLVIFWS